jgi:T5SS/PEP-CTERM-associated repeat protein
MGLNLIGGGRREFFPRAMAVTAIGLLLACCSAARAAVTTTGSIYDDGTNYEVGYAADGTLSIDAGSVLSRSQSYLGYGQGCTGTATVTGTGSVWTNGWLVVGRLSNGTLNVEAGGQVSTGGYGEIGATYQTTGTATVSGSGSKWTSGLALYVGFGGVGTLDIQAGGQVGDPDGYLGYLGYDAVESMGTATVAGAGSEWTNTGGLYLDDGGSGALTVSDGGLVTARTLYASLSNLFGNGTITANGAVLDADFVFDSSHGLAQAFSFGTGGTLNLNFDGTGDLGAGYKAAGTLRIADGITVASASGYLGFQVGSAGAATVTGPGSKWSNSGTLYVGYSGSGTLNVQNGGQVSDYQGQIGTYSGSTGAATVTGAGSTWTNTFTLFVDSGTLKIQAGGQVTSAESFIGNYSTGTAIVTGAGSKWTNSSSLIVGYHGSGTLTVSDGGTVTAQSLTIASLSSVQLNISGSGMIVLGDATTTGSVINNGSINLYAGQSLAGGVYTPISEFAGRALAWSGSGVVNAYGGTWNATAMTFTASAATQLNAGVSGAAGSGQRLLFADSASGKQVEAGFGAISSGTTFSASLSTAAERGSLTNTAGFTGSILSAWDFATNLTNTPVLLSFNIGTGQANPQIWQLAGGTWKTCSPSVSSYGSDGVLCFTASTFGGFAVVGNMVGDNIPGDINGDGLVDVADYNIWAANVGRTGATWSQGDLNGDGLVDVADYNIWAANVGETASTPEPATLSLLALGAFGFLRRRGRAQGIRVKAG